MGLNKFAISKRGGTKVLDSRECKEKGNTALVPGGSYAVRTDLEYFCF
jgi:hypothetical protein